MGISRPRIDALGPLVLPPAGVEELRALVAVLEPTLAGNPMPHDVPIAEQRAGLLGTTPPPIPEGVDASITFDGRQVAVRTFTPPDPHGAFLHLHGGGWTMGSASTQDPRLWQLANDLGLTVVSVDYRLAPEHHLRDAVEDCTTAARWLIEQWPDAPRGIGGESAGAHLAALTLVRLRDDGVTGAFAAADLAYGAYDLGLTDFALAWGERRLVLSVPIFEWHLDQCLPGLSREQRKDPAWSPLHADLHDLCPALFSHGTEDLLHDDSLLLAARWEAAGNESQLDTYEGAFHAFDMFPGQLAAVAQARRFAFLQHHLGRS